MRHWYQTECSPPCEESRAAAQARQSRLTKPAGSLGLLEDVAVDFAGWQATERPSLESVMVRVFAADHGICAQKISAFPQQVTAQMVLNFINGGAAIRVLSELSKADFAVVSMGLATPLPPVDSAQLMRFDVAPGTADFSQKAAMTEAQMFESLRAGQLVIESSQPQAPADPPLQLFVGGEMGIGNTSSAAAIYASLLGISSQLACGPGTGLSHDGVAHKSQVVENALAIHGLAGAEPAAERVLQAVGGFEIAALAGAYIGAAQRQLPSLIDGFIATAAALLAVRLNPSCRKWMLFAHRSAEPAHPIALEALQANPLLDLGLRLGEGSGAALALPLLKSALAIHNGMATFEEAAVAAKLA